MMRLIVSGASTVWSVESTRWPVSAADSAVWTVSSSRISPIRITSGSWRSTRRSARLKEAVSMPTSRWLMIERLSVVQELDRVLDRDDVLGVGLVDVVDHRGERRRLARAGRAGDQDDPALLLGQLADRPAAAPSSSTVGSSAGSRGRRARRAALAEGVDAEAREPLDRVGEVDLVLRRRTPRSLLVGSSSIARARARCPPGVSSASPAIGRELAVDADQRRRRRLQVQVGAAGVDELAQGSVDVEHGSSIGARRPGLE